jgi:Restriction endonuclease
MAARLQGVAQMTARSFENLVFDLLQASGMMNLTWRTPGPDGGRDIEGITSSQDASGYSTHQRWYIECKRYTRSIGWPTVWEKIGYAENQNANFLLLVTNSNPSPRCETEISQWNAGRRSLKVRVWRGYDLDRLFTVYPSVAAKYGLRAEIAHLRSGLIELASELMKIVQSAYAAHGLARDVQPALEAAAALSELLSLRLDDLRRYGHVVASVPVDKSCYEWADSGPALAKFEEVSARAVLSVFRYLTAASSVQVETHASGATFRAVAPRFPVAGAARRTLEVVTLWTTLDITIPADPNETIHVSPRNAAE